jgi:hypothetical protein
VDGGDRLRAVQHVHERRPERHDLHPAGFPSEVRAAGHGFAAGAAKLGAAIGVFLFPILLDDIGTSALLVAIAGACVVAFAVTLALRIEPRGRSLDELSGDALADLAPRPVPP